MRNHYLASVHLHAVLAFVMWKEDGMEWMGLKIVGDVGGTSEAVLPFFVRASEVTNFLPPCLQV